MPAPTQRQARMDKNAIKAGSLHHALALGTTVGVLLFSSLVYLAHDWISAQSQQLGLGDALTQSILVGCALLGSQFLTGTIWVRFLRRTRDKICGRGFACDAFSNSLVEARKGNRAASATIQGVAAFDRAVHDRLGEAIQDTESSTLGVIERTTRLNTSAVQLLDYLTGSTLDASNMETDFEAGVDEITDIARFVQELPPKIRDDMAAIQSVVDDIRQLEGLAGSIKGISKQTNLLALNAAIEAARAGEQGRGFAVVADEVRTLASRTQQSTQEINQMIERLRNGASEAVEVMEQGRVKADVTVTQASKATDALQAITQVVDGIKAMNMQIASAAEQQSATAEEINRNIVNISDVANDTATGSRQTATASDELARLAVDLQVQVDRFQVS